MKCTIKWVDDQGNPTPDKNEAIGFAVYWRKEHGGATSFEQRYPICAKHLEEMPTTADAEWYPGTGYTTSGWRFEAQKQGE